MLILKLSLKKSPLLLLRKKSPILKLFKSMKPLVFVIKWFVITIRNILNEHSFIEVKMSLSNSFINCTKKSKNVKKVIEKDFQTLLVMTASDEEDFQKAEKCWICDRKYKAENTEVTEKTEEEKEKERIANEPVRDHCHITVIYYDLAGLAK